ncbi:MFS transporter [Sphingomonas montanisoli]|uniref:MFS transporter n=1 Tax=Sphingomonas montanisoli TaxID=2606412 RepID=A0A5D9C7Z8_9SPHN|nr:MFS transporter [Sphingomonas montanisoli]TZG27829.1 MFS transporter [Sphingomonas montanisoli]
MAEATAAAISEDEPKGGLIGWFSIGILMVMTILSYLDRGIIALMVDPIKADLHLTDVQFSLIQGFAFALFYALSSVPMGWLADRFSRRWVVYFGVTGWSIATMLCGMAQSYWQLFAARFAVGMGEATLSPSSYAIVGDLFPKRRLTFAIGVLAGGIAIGGGLSLAIGGFVMKWAEGMGGLWGFKPWQVTFLVVGAPGILIAPLIFLIPRPKRALPTAQEAAALAAAPGYGAWLRANAFYITTISIGVGLHAILAYAVAGWAPAYLGRHFGYDAAKIGSTLGLVQGVAGFAGFVGGGWLVDWLHNTGMRDAHYRYFVVNCIALTVVGVIAFTVIESAPVVLLMIGMIHIMLPFTSPAIAHIQVSTPQRFRARTIAIFMVVLNLIGMITGPSIVAIFTEKVYGGAEHVGLGIATTYAIFGPASAIVLLIGLRAGRKAIAANGAG